MRKPRAQVLNKSSDSDTPSAKPKSNPKPQKPRVPKAFAPKNAILQKDTPQDWNTDEQLIVEPTTRRANWILRIALSAGGLLVSLGVALMADRLLSDLYARYDWLGWLGAAALTLFVFAILVLIGREILALKSLRNLDALRKNASLALATDRPKDGHAVISQLQNLYQARPDLAKARQQLDLDISGQLDGAPMIHAAERHLMGQLDIKAKALTAASARRVAIVTAISPRALVDIAFVAYESMKLARAIATLYGARPGLLGSWRLAREILSHLAITGGVALGDSVVQQLLGHGLAAKLSARLGEGLVNGLMSVRVGIAAMRVTRPLPYDRLKQPKVMDFMADLASITQGETK